MKKVEVVVGQRYIMKVSGKLVPVLVTNVCQYGGWYGTNTKTNRDVRIRSAAKLRYTEAQWKEMQTRIKAARERVVDTPLKPVTESELRCPKCGAVQHPSNNACWNCYTRISTPVPHASQT